MGWGNCRVPGCEETTSVDYGAQVRLGGKLYNLTVCGMWRHYAEVHCFQPTDLERRVVMGGTKVGESRKIAYRGISEPAGRPELVAVMFVEKKNGGYSHEQGTSPDVAWINALASLIGFDKGTSYMGI